MYRSLVNGTISWSLISIPVAFYKTTDEPGSVSFRQITPCCQVPTKQQTVCSKCGKEHARGELLCGWAIGNDEYLIFTQDEVKEAKDAPENTNVLAIEATVPVHEIDLLEVDHTYYLTPRGKNAAEIDAAAQSYAILREALNIEGRVAVGWISCQGSTWLAAIEAKGKGLRANFLRPRSCIRAQEGLDAVPKDVPATMVELANQLIDRMPQTFDFNSYRDDVAESVQAAVTAKLAKKPITPKAAQPKAAPKATSINDLLKAAIAAAPKGAPGTAAQGSNVPQRAKNRAETVAYAMAKAERTATAAFTPQADAKARKAVAKARKAR